MAIKVHFLGIGGSGASAAAAIAQAQGYEITGCDLEPHNEFTESFDKSILFKGHHANHLNTSHAELVSASNKIPKQVRNDEMIDILAVTPAIYSLDPDNPELQTAKEKNIPIMTWQQFLGKYLTKNKFVIAIAGTHGKTTTTAMIAQILEDAGKDPTVLLGAINPKWGTNFRVSKRHPEPFDSAQGRLDSGSIQNRFRIKSGMTKKGYFVVEADEFNDNFLTFHPDISVVTNIEMDHPEYFKDFEAVKSSFRKFLESTKQTIVANLSDPVINDILYVHPKGVNTIIDYSKHPIDFKLQIPGQFNILNASAAFQVGLLLSIKPQTIKQSLSSYTGVGRRFEYIGTFHGATVYSDFGHHPTEIKVTTEAAREKFPKSRILLVFQPHMFSRTKALFADFVKVFKKAPVDKTFIMDIYPSREVDTGTVSSQQLVEAVNKNSVLYIGSANQTLDKIKPEIKDGDIVFFMSAGDTDYLAKKLTSSLN